MLAVHPTPYPPLPSRMVQALAPHPPCASTLKVRKTTCLDKAMLLCNVQCKKKHMQRKPAHTSPLPLGVLKGGRNQK